MKLKLNYCQLCDRPITGLAMNQGRYCYACYCAAVHGNLTLVSPSYSKRPGQPAMAATSSNAVGDTRERTNFNFAGWCVGGLKILIANSTSVLRTGRRSFAAIWTLAVTAPGRRAWLFIASHARFCFLPAQAGASPRGTANTTDVDCPSRPCPSLFGRQVYNRRGHRLGRWLAQSHKEWGF